MVLREVLREKGVSGPSEFGKRIGIVKQHAWLLWHGMVLPSTETMQKIHGTFKVPLQTLMRLDRGSPRPGKGRPRKGDV
jgi:transcriptional regulator with XRE-family HTH domain